MIGGWEAKTGHNTPVYKDDNETVPDDPPQYIKSKFNCNAALQTYIARGIPRSKIVMGLALYGRGWQGKLHYSFIHLIQYFLFVFVYRSY